MSSGTSPRVVHVITRYGAGGSERRLRDMVTATPHLEHLVVVGALAAPDRTPEQLGEVPVHVEAHLRRSPHPYHDLRSLRSLQRLLRRVRPDLVVTHQSKGGLLGRLAAARLGIPTLHSLSMASFGPGYPRAVRALFRRVERAMVPRTTAYAVVGHDLAATYRRLGVPADRLHVIRSAAPLPDEPVDRDRARAALRRRAGLAPDRPVLAYVGSLDARKNVLALLDLLERLGAASPEQTRPGLVVAGDGPLHAELRSRARSRHVTGDVAFLGHLDDPGPVFGGADLVVLLSRTEGLPQVLVQAAAAGTPFVAFDVSGTRELLAAGARGTVVPWGDLDAAGHAVTALLEASGETGRRLDLHDWDPALVGRRHAELIDELLASTVVDRAR